MKNLTTAILESVDFKTFRINVKRYAHAEFISIRTRSMA